jgi:transposase InsO family protein
MKYELIQTHREMYPVKTMCELLAVSESGYYAWLKREPGQRMRQDAELKARIVSIWNSFRGIYGAPRIYKELKAQGMHISQKRVARLMREAGIQGKMAGRKRPQTTRSDDSHPVAPNLLNRQFKVTEANKVWLTDITYIETKEGYLYTAAVLDLGSRQLVGLAMADHMRTELVLQALDMAIVQQQPSAGLLHHSDRGSQYTSHDYQQKLKDAQFLISMSRRGSCLDNAPMESFWATLKRECADHIFETREQARTTIFAYVMGFYNRIRRHSAIDYQAPITRAA